MLTKTALLIAVAVPGAAAFSLPGSAGLVRQQARPLRTNVRDTTVMSAEAPGVGRRQLLAGAAALGIQGAFQAPSWAEPAVYKNADRGFSFTPPEGWTEVRWADSEGWGSAMIHPQRLRTWSQGSRVPGGGGSESSSHHRVGSPLCNPREVRHPQRWREGSVGTRS